MLINFASYKQTCMLHIRCFIPLVSYKQTPEWLEPVDVDHLLDEDDDERDGRSNSKRDARSDGKRDGRGDGKRDGKSSPTKHNTQSFTSEEGNDESASDKDRESNGGSVGDGSVDGHMRETKVHESEWDGDLGWAAGEEEGPNVVDDDGIVVYEDNMQGEGFDEAFGGVDRLLTCRNACDCEYEMLFCFVCRSDGENWKRGQVACLQECV
jgi:hypothetical protein